MNGTNTNPDPAPESILVIRLSSLGDVILATPVIRQLQRTYPDAIIDVAVREQYGMVYTSNPRVRRVWNVAPSVTADSDMDNWKLAMLDTVPGGRYDLVVDLQNNVASTAVRHGLGMHTVKYPKFRMQKLAMVWLKKFPSATTHVIDRYRMALANYPLALDTDGPELWLPEERASGVYKPDPSRRMHGEQPATGTLEGLQIGISPGARHFTKRWPAESYGQLCAQLVRMGARVMLVGGTADTDACNRVANVAGVPVQRADGATTLDATVRALDACDVLVGNDSAVMHMAAARRIPTIAIFGSSVRELGFTPYGVRYHIVEYNIRCRPCSHIGRQRCPQKHFKCMLMTTPNQVMQAILKLV
ncbi:MAG: hypothetical protein OKBPIBMD_00237 [Chlorobi bacterium]|nr:MAG: family 9 glycosyl transferase [Chlorobi bacterium OLB6]MBV6462821.1 hypothetical protein [Chlorobiota bacterium]MBW7854436.1 glycosyltransferase family 9 protein [Candidatus Kapabacteria bacterium]MCC6331706.1 glycosyltransferase family 9 protein [Ignavibacteria bacterium]MBZ0194570.1 glycosyltransferase family 9 protein [Candidatus Kapabacteria bacterium]